ncbi:MAG: M2 family metallopeptidase [Gemmataceae bacterium]
MTPDRRSFLLAGGAAVASLAVPEVAHADAPADAAKLIADHEKDIRPLEIAAGLAWWNANVSGKDSDFKNKEEAQNKIDAALSNPEKFATLKALKAAGDKGELKDPLVKRQIDLLYLGYLEKQVDPDLLKRITAKANAVEQQFNVFRAKVDGKEMPDSEVRSVLKTSSDSAIRQKVWEASKLVGKAVEADLKELVGYRNDAAKKLGFANFHALQLALSEQTGEELIKLFDELDALTKEPFTAAKAEIDEKLAAKYSVKAEDLMPWHYFDPFFQESPAVFKADLDAPFAGTDIRKLCEEFYAGIGLPIADVLARSDLFEKSGKSPHAFCTDIDREGDVRVLANIKPNEYWAGTMLHELGHAVYSSKNIPKKLPYVLRAEAHILCTEGVAMQFERFSKSRVWLAKMGVPIGNAADFEAAATKVQRNQLLIFSRWCQVMLRFEKGMYENPAQDLNKLWWDLVEKYQQVKRPKGRNAPDYASKIHICSAPVYYHNYMMGQLFASQVHHALSKELGTPPNATIYIGNKAVGDFMKKKVFEPGRTYDWKGLTKFATGEELSPKAFSLDFQGK